MKIDKTLVLTSWVVVEPADDIPGLWVAHCLDYDVISQGDSPAHAVESVTEAIAMTVIDDLINNLDPGERRAPAEFWDQLAHILRHGKEAKLSEAGSLPGRVVLATQQTLILERDERAPSSDLDFSQFNVPPSTAHIDQCAA